MRRQWELVLSYARQMWQVEGDHPWIRYPSFTVLRHPETGTWFALLMAVSRSALHLSGEGSAFCINLKCDPADGMHLRTMPGILPAYHMNKTHWITVLLEEEVSDTLLLDLLRQSFEQTMRRRKRNGDGSR